MVGGLRGSDSMFRGQGLQRHRGPTSGSAAPTRQLGTGRRAVAVADHRPPGPTQNARQRLRHPRWNLRRRPVPALVGPSTHRAGAWPSGGAGGWARRRAWWTPATAVSATTHSSASGRRRSVLPQPGPRHRRLRMHRHPARGRRAVGTTSTPAGVVKPAVPDRGRLLRLEPGRRSDRRRRQGSTRPRSGCPPVSGRQRAAP